MREGLSAPDVEVLSWGWAKLTMFTSIPTRFSGSDMHGSFTSWQWLQLVMLKIDTSHDNTFFCVHCKYCQITEYVEIWASWPQRAFRQISAFHSWVTIIICIYFKMENRKKLFYIIQSQILFTKRGRERFSIATPVPDAVTKQTQRSNFLKWEVKAEGCSRRHKMQLKDA